MLNSGDIQSSKSVKHNVRKIARVEKSLTRFISLSTGNNHVITRAYDRMGHTSGIRGDSVAENIRLGFGVTVITW